jgi:hypothetical protein
MAETLSLHEHELGSLLERVRAVQAAVSLRVDGTARLLGDLRVCAVAPGEAFQLEGAKPRDLLPAAGAAVTLSFLLADSVVSMHTVLLEPERARTLRAAWPRQPLDRHRRDEVRVATPDLPPLGAVLVVGGQRIAAKLLNLTETGMGLGLQQAPPVPVHGEVGVETLLPGDLPVRMVGEVRHSGELEDDPLPFRIGLVLRELQSDVQEALRRVIQARRIIRSEAIREEE